MDRIESVDGSHLSRRSSRKKGKSTKKLKGRTFASAIAQVGEQESPFLDLDDQGPHRENLEGLLDDVHERGEMLVQSQTLENIKRYKQAVSAFLEYVVNNLLAVEQRNSGGNILRRKRFTQVKIVDAKLERLVAAVLQNQGKQLDLLEKINEIQGLLVDLIT